MNGRQAHGRGQMRKVRALANILSPSVWRSLDQSAVVNRINTGADYIACTAGDFLSREICARKVLIMRTARVAAVAADPDPERSRGCDRRTHKG